MDVDDRRERRRIPVLDDRRAVRLLFVEDDDDFRTMLRSLVRRIKVPHEFEALFLGNVQDARRVVEAARVDVVFSDFDLPDGTAADVLRHAMLLAPASTRIVITGAPERAADRSSASDHHGIWPKDLSMEELSTRLTSVILGVGFGRGAS